MWPQPISASVAFLWLFFYSSFPSLKLFLCLKYVDFKANHTTTKLQNPFTFVWNLSFYLNSFFIYLLQKNQKTSYVLSQFSFFEEDQWVNRSNNTSSFFISPSTKTVKYLLGPLPMSFNSVLCWVNGSGIKQRNQRSLTDQQACLPQKTNRC